MIKGIRSKLNARQFCPSKDLADIAIAKMNDQPVAWAEELCMVHTIQQEDGGKRNFQLTHDWQSTYDKKALWGKEPEQAAKIYLEALAWTFAYYRGEKVDTHWLYPWPLPPRTETVLHVLERDAAMAQVPNSNRDPIKPLEQLAMVLPQSSFHLLPQEYAQLISDHPYAWPTAWPVYSFGRRFLWECEPLIPLIKPNQIKQWIETLYETQD